MPAAAIPSYLEFDDGDKPYIEQIHGRRERKVSPKLRHARLQWRIAAALDRHLGDLGDVGTECRCFLIENEEKPSSLLPDVSYYSFERLPRNLEEDERERPRIAPDIAFEILSPRESRRRISEKTELYLRHGARLVAVLDPKTRLLKLLAANNAETTVEAHGKMSFSLPTTI